MKVQLKEHYWPNPPGTVIEIDDVRGADIIARGVAVPTELTLTEKLEEAPAEPASQEPPQAE